MQMTRVQNIMAACSPQMAFMRADTTPRTSSVLPENIGLKACSYVQTLLRLFLFLSLFSSMLLFWAACFRALAIFSLKWDLERMLGLAITGIPAGANPASFCRIES